MSGSEKIVTNILIIYEFIEATNIELDRVFGMLQKKGVLLRRFKTATKVYKDDLIWCDIMLFVRSTSIIEFNLITLGRKMNKYIVLMLDDDLLSLDDSYGAIGQGYWGGRQRILRKNLSQINCLIAVNELLAKKYVKLGNISKYVLLNTIIEKSEMFSPQQNSMNDNKVKIALYVNDGTQNMFNEIIRPVIPMLCKYYAEQVALYFIGLKPNMKEFKNKIEINYVSHMPYRDFKKKLGMSGFDIGLAPLVDTGFACYKYFNKYIEYTLAGIPAIYSDCLLYGLVIESGFNGLVCENNPVAWFKAISRLIENPSLRRSLIDNAQFHIYDNFQSEKILARLVKDMPELVGYKSKKNDVPFLTPRLRMMRLNYIIFKVRGWLYAAKNCIRKGNIMLLMRRIIRRIIKSVIKENR